MDKFGLTENEKLTNLHNYNHALFRNMVFFMDIVWEINMLTKTVAVLEDRNEPERAGREFTYEELFESYREKYLSEKEKGLFEDYLAFENLPGLREEVSFDIRFKICGEEELHRIVLMPAFDENHTLYCVYLGARNLQSEVRTLRDAFDAANSANAAKTDFLARMSHDIRTPMNAIIGMTAIATRHLGNNNERVADCLKEISSSGKYLLALLSEVLDMSKIESGRMELVETSFDIAELFENIMTICKFQCKQKNLDFSVYIQDMPHTKVIGDIQRVQQAVMNIADNAIKYTPEGGRVSISLTEKPTNRPNIGCYEFVVADTGIGISPEYMQHLFEPFLRSEDRRVLKVQGTGLGMPIARNIIQMMNGTIDVQSTLNEGTTVTVNIFLKLQKAEDVSTQQETSDVPLAMFQNGSYMGKRALLAEDNDSNAEIAKEILSMTGLRVEHVWNGQDAVDKIANGGEGYYDIVFMDIQMPVMDGYEATKAIRAMKSDYAKNIPILAMSANAFAEDVRQSLACGMNDHIAKPIDFDQLAKDLELFLK